MDLYPDESAPASLGERENELTGYRQGTSTIPDRGTEFQYYARSVAVRPLGSSLSSFSSSSCSSVKETQLTKFYDHHPMQQQQQQHQLDLSYLDRPMKESEFLYEPTRDGNAWSHSNYAGADGIFRAADDRLETLQKMSLARSMLRSALEGGSGGTKLPRRAASTRTMSKKRTRQAWDGAYEEADGLIVEKSGSVLPLNTYALSTVGRCSKGLFFFTLMLAMVLAGLSFKFGDEIKEGLVRLTDNFREIPSTLYCNVIMVNIAFENGYHLEDLLPYQFYECIPFVVVDGAEDNHGDFSYQIRQLPLDFTDQHKHEILMGNFQMSIEGGEIDKQQLIVRIPDGAKIKQVRYPEADFVGSKTKLKQTDSAAIGDKKILVLRISTKDVAPRFPAKELYSYIFDPNQVSVTSQYEQCSFGKLSMQPTEYGVMDVNIGRTMAQVDRSPAAIVAAATESARDLLGITGNQSLNDIADFVFYCLPAGTGHWAAYSGVNHWRSVYNDQWCAYQTGTMKELGHGLGLFHASEGGARYTDFTGYMGAGYAAVRWPEKCFNAQNNWHLGWYSDRAAEVDLSAGVQLFKVVSFVHYDRITKDDEYVLLKLNDLYMNFNVDKGFNRDTGEKKNQLTVVQGDMGDTTLVAGLDMLTSSLSWENYQGSASILTIEICELVLDSDSELDYVVVSIGLDGSLCPDVESVTRKSSTYIDTGDHCDDSPHGWFFVDATIGNQKISALQQCGWLLENLDLIDLFCNEGQVAYDMCAETCGKCSDGCADSSDVEFSIEGLTVNCEWLSIRPGFWDSACVEGSIAHNECKETCNSCHIVETFEPASAGFVCEDTEKSVFWVDEIWGYQSCFWLSAMTDRHEDLCVEGKTAYLTCPETCGVCDDSCDDGDGLFEDASGILRDCKWLSLRPFFWEDYCGEGQIANDLCMETCQSC